jgi:hypothetical protein
MRQSVVAIERRLVQNAADIRSRMAEMQKLKLAVKRAEGSLIWRQHSIKPPPSKSKGLRPID